MSSSEIDTGVSSPEDELVRGRARRGAPQAPHGTRADRRHPCLRRCHWRGVRVRTPAHRGLRRRLGRDPQAVVAVARRAWARDAPQPRHLRAAARGCASRALLLPRVARHARVDGARGRSGRRRGWHGDDGRDAARARLQRPPRRARRRRRHEPLEPVGDPRARSSPSRALRRRAPETARWRSRRSSASSCSR